jgi:SH3-like domain-containing protein
MRRILPLLALAASLGAQAGEFMSVAESAAVLYDAPSRQATPLYVVSRHYPLERIVELDAWVKVRDHTGAISWVEKRLLAERRMALVVHAPAQARLRPEAGAPVAFVAAENVVLEVLRNGTPDGWLRVRHEDGTGGYMRSAHLWGQ